MKNRKTRNHLKPHRALAALCLAGAALLAQGCGKQAYVVTASQSGTQAPGSFSVPPKVDILLVQDDTGSSQPIWANIAGQLDTFMSNLQGQGWDYHLATIPLTSYREVTQVLASQYDPNWGSQWQQPYPGAAASSVEAVSAAAFRTPGNYSDFLTEGYQGASNGSEPALANLESMLNDYSMKSSGFLRPDAMLAVVLLSTGDDTSNRNMCTQANGHAQSDGWEGPCDLIHLDQQGGNPSLLCGTSGANPVPYCNNYYASLQPYETFLRHFKTNSAQMRFFSVVAQQHYVSGNNCLAGTNAFLGQRYDDLSNYLGGQSFDICSTPIPNALQGIASNLTAIQLTFYTSYLFMAQQPDPATIVVYRNPGGDTSQAVEIPQDPNNGWTFAGNVSNVYTTSIGSPAATPTLNLGSGWAVQLHGSGIIGGTDTATVQFKPLGAQNSAQ
jgi:hypothetical protein